MSDNDPVLASASEAAEKSTSSGKKSIKKANKPHFFTRYKSIISLLLITTFISLAVSAVNSLTGDTIVEQERETTLLAMEKVMPGADTFSPIDISSGNYSSMITGLSEAIEEGSTLGYCVSVTSPGFGGGINMIVGVSTDGTVLGVKIVSMTETPGLGTKTASTDFTDGFVGKDITMTLVSQTPQADNEVQAVSGATISSKAVYKGVSEAVKTVLSYLSKISGQGKPLGGDTE